ncbi:MAG: tetratricopeptide repeat protein, partial [Verrucomicrobiota bacterium]
RFVPRAESTLRRIGGDPLLQSWIYTATAHVLNLRGKYAEALQVEQKALDIKRAVLGDNHWDVALSLGNVAAELQSLGRASEALVQNQRAIVSLESALGREHPDLALHVYNRGEIRLALGQSAEARAEFERALSIWKAELPADHLYNSYALMGIGLARLSEESSIAEAIAPLERALAIRQAGAATPEMRAETAFALARALWEAGAHPERDRARARQLAEIARDLFPASRAADRAKVEAVLAAWQRGDRQVGVVSARRRPDGGLRGGLP